MKLEEVRDEDKETLPLPFTELELFLEGVTAMGERIRLVAPKLRTDNAAMVKIVRVFDQFENVLPLRPSNAVPRQADRLFVVFEAELQPYNVTGELYRVEVVENEPLL